MWTWDFAPPSRKEFLSLPEAAQLALVAFMEGIIGDDPLGIRESAAKTDPGGVYLPLPFGGDGVVTVVVHVRGEHVLVIQIIWAGEG